MIRALLRWTLTLALLGLLALCGTIAFRFFQFTNTTIDFNPARQISVPQGATMAEIAQTLTDGHQVGEAWQWILLAKIKRADRAIKAGDYVLSGRMSTADILDKMVRGDVLLQGVRIPEGQTVAAIRAQLLKNKLLVDDQSQLSEKELALRLGHNNPHNFAPLEGWLAPNTYKVLRGTSALSVLRESYQLMQKQLAEEWANRHPNLPLRTPEEALILASIVEKETGLARDRALVASVFINRLMNNMPLQSDPTVIYGLGESYRGNITKAHLQTPSLYNTYTIPRLPPTPIASVSLASLRSTLQPESSPYYYFVARGDGSSQFSRTLAEHNNAVNVYQRQRRISSPNEE